VGHPGFGRAQLKPRTNPHFTPNALELEPSPAQTQASDLSRLRRRFVRVEGRREEMAATEGVLLGMGNPLLDISAVVDDAFLTK
jgi:hypothetical protein